MGNISRQQTAITRDRISKLLELGLSHDKIIDQLQIDKSTFYRHLKTMREQEVKLWSKIEIDNTKYRALNLLRSFEETARICTNIALSEKTSNKDRIEACKARDMANAHILRLVNEGTMFQHLPEVKAYVKTMDVQQQQPIRQLEYNDSIDNNNNIINNNNNNLNKFNSDFDSDSDSDSIDVDVDNAEAEAERD